MIHGPINISIRLHGDTRGLLNIIYEKIHFRNKCESLWEVTILVDCQIDTHISVSQLHFKH
jgi:hypothetical protein